MKQADVDLQKTRIDKYEYLSALAAELNAAVKAFEDNAFTGNTSQVKKVRGIRIDFVDAPEIVIKNPGLIGWDIKTHLLPLIEAKRKKVWDERDAL